MRRRRFDLPGRALKALGSTPLAVRVGVGVLALIGLAFAVNWTYQVLRKPAELFFPVSHALSKVPTQTWRQYHPLFGEHATAVMTGDFLAALARVEDAGNPVPRTSWRWRKQTRAFGGYRQAPGTVALS